MKPGEKYILEIESVSKMPNGDIAFIKGFRALVFDEIGLRKLKKFDKADYDAKIAQSAYTRGWNASRAALPSAQGAIDDAYKRGWNECAEKIQNIKDAAYQNGLDDAWKLARRLCMRPCDGGMSAYDLGKAFGYTILGSIFRVYESYSKAFQKFKAWEQENAEIHVGDEVKFKLSDRTFVVAKVDGEFISGFSADGSQFCDKRSCNWEKTGRHFDLDALFKFMGGGDGA